MIDKLLVNELDKTSSDKEVAILLSGGVDSLSILFAARRLNKSITAYTFHLDNQPTYDSNKAVEVCNMFDVKCKVIEIPTGNLEVDFIVRDNEGFTQYIQVSQTVQNPTTLERELAPFNSIADHHEKLLITMDYEVGTYNGIKKLNAIDWLLKIEY